MARTLRRWNFSSLPSDAALRRQNSQPKRKMESTYASYSCLFNNKSKNHKQNQEQAPELQLDVLTTHIHRDMTYAPTGNSGIIDRL